MPRTSHLGGLSLATTSTFSLGGRAVRSAALTPTQALVQSFQAQRGLVDVLLVFDPAHYTTPGSMPGHLVDALGGDISYDAPNTQATPTAVLDASGYSYASADGVDDTLIASATQVVAWYCAVFRSPPGQTTWNDLGPLLGRTVNADPKEAMLPGGTTFYPGIAPRSVRRNGVALASPFDLSPITDWCVGSIYSASVGMTTNFSLFSFAGHPTHYHLTALAIRYTDPTSDQQTAIESRLAPVRDALLASA